MRKENHSYVKNAADAEQVKEAGRKVQDRRKQELDDIREITSSVAGRRFMWRLLEHCKVFESIWEPSAKIHHNAGRQDVGHFLMAEVVAADEAVLLKMMSEAKNG